MHLKLLIPELVWSNPDDRLVYDALDGMALPRLLARGRLRRSPAQAPEELLTASCGLATPSPVAALRLLGDGGTPGADEWICADPVHLRFHQERLVLADAARIGIEPDEAQALVAALNAEFGDAGEFVAAASRRWALRLKAPVDRAWPPLSQAVGREVRLDALLGDRRLKRLGHETQMWLHAHPLNAARERAGKLPVNALWFWGPGRLDEAVRRPASVDRLYADSPLAHGIARHAGIAGGPGPSTLADLLDEAPAGHVVVELDRLAAAAHYENGDDYVAAWHSLDRDWFSGLPGALRRGRIASLEIVAPSSFGQLEWTLGRLAAWTPWGGKQAFSSIVRALAEKNLP